MLQFSENNKHLSNVHVNTKTEFKVFLTNKGTQLITIEMIKPCCSSCSTGSVSKQNILSNESIVLSMTFTPTSTTSVPVSKCMDIYFHIGNGASQSSRFNFIAKVQ